MHAYKNSEHRRAGTAMTRALRLLSTLWTVTFTVGYFKLFRGSAN